MRENTLRVRPIARRNGGRPLQVSVIYVNAGGRRIARRYLLPSDLISRPATAQVGWAIGEFIARLDEGWSDVHRAVSRGWGDDGWWQADVVRGPLPVDATVRTLFPGRGTVYYRGQVLTVGGALEFDDSKWRVTVQVEPYADLPERESDRVVEWVGTPEELYRWVYRP